MDIRTKAVKFTHIARVLPYKHDASETEKDVEQNQYFALGNAVTEIYSVRRTELQGGLAPIWELEVSRVGDSEKSLVPVGDVLYDYPKLLETFCRGYQPREKIEQMLAELGIQWKPSQKGSLNGGGVAPAFVPTMPFVSTKGRSTTRFDLHGHSSSEEQERDSDDEYND